MSKLIEQIPEFWDYELFKKATEHAKYMQDNYQEDNEVGYFQYLCTLTRDEFIDEISEYPIL
jgi:hypothetical protein